MGKNFVAQEYGFELRTMNYSTLKQKKNELSAFEKALQNKEKPENNLNVLNVFK